MTDRNDGQNDKKKNNVQVIIKQNYPLSFSWMALFIFDMLLFCEHFEPRLLNSDELTG